VGFGAFDEEELNRAMEQSVKQARLEERARRRRKVEEDIALLQMATDTAAARTGQVVEEERQDTRSSARAAKKGETKPTTTDAIADEEPHLSSALEPTSTRSLPQIAATAGLEPAVAGLNDSSRLRTTSITTDDTTVTSPCASVSGVFRPLCTDDVVGQQLQRATSIAATPSPAPVNTATDLFAGGSSEDENLATSVATAAAVEAAEAAAGSKGSGTTAAECSRGSRRTFQDAREQEAGEELLQLSPNIVQGTPPLLMEEEESPDSIESDTLTVKGGFVAPALRRGHNLHAGLAVSHDEEGTLALFSEISSAGFGTLTTDDRQPGTVVPSVCGSGRDADEVVVSSRSGQEAWTEDQETCPPALEDSATQQPFQHRPSMEGDVEVIAAPQTPPAPLATALTPTMLAAEEEEDDGEDKERADPPPVVLVTGIVHRQQEKALRTAAIRLGYSVVRGPTLKPRLWLNLWLLFNLAEKPRCFSDAAQISPLLQVRY